MEAAPSFDTVAIQDHIGQGYPSSFQNVSDYFLRSRHKPVEAARLWANSDLRPARWADARPVALVRLPQLVADWPRVKARLSLEASLPHVTTLIAWEWTGCLAQPAPRGRTLRGAVRAVQGVR